MYWFKFCIELLSFWIEMYFGIILVTGKMRWRHERCRPRLNSRTPTLEGPFQTTHLYERDSLEGACYWVMFLDTWQVMTSHRHFNRFAVIESCSYFSYINQHLKWFVERDFLQRIQIVFVDPDSNITCIPFDAEDRIIICQIPGETKGDFQVVKPLGPYSAENLGFGPLVSICFDFEMDPVK